MSTAQVTIKVSPQEHKIIQDALEMYAYAMRHMLQGSYQQHPLKGFQFKSRLDIDIRKLAATASRIRREIS